MEKTTNKYLCKFDKKLSNFIEIRKKIRVFLLENYKR